MIFLLRLYQFCLSPFLGSRCRFYPSCSEYSLQAFQQHSFFKAFYLMMKRLACCHPGHSGGVDQVPSP